MSYNDEMGGVELARASQRFGECKHELVTRQETRYTQDARKEVVNITTCKKGCSYYVVEVIKREDVSEEAMMW